MYCRTGFDSDGLIAAKIATKSDLIGFCYREYTHYTLYGSCPPIYGVAIIRSLLFFSSPFSWKRWHLCRYQIRFYSNFSNTATVVLLQPEQMTVIDSCAINYHVQVVWRVLGLLPPPPAFLLQMAGKIYGNGGKCCCRCCCCCMCWVLVVVDVGTLRTQTAALQALRLAPRLRDSQYVSWYKVTVSELTIALDPFAEFSEYDWNAIGVSVWHAGRGGNWRAVKGCHRANKVSCLRETDCSPSHPSSGWPSVLSPHLILLISTLVYFQSESSRLLCRFFTSSFLHASPASKHLSPYHHASPCLLTTMHLPLPFCTLLYPSHCVSPTLISVPPPSLSFRSLLPLSSLFLLPLPLPLLSSPSFLSHVFLSLFPLSLPLYLSLSHFCPFSLPLSFLFILSAPL